MRIKLIFLFALLTTLIVGQTRVPDSAIAVEADPFISLIKIIDSSNPGKNRSLFNKILGFIAGNEQLELNSPVNVLALDPENILIVNQGDGTILKYIDGELKGLPANKKSLSTFPSPVGICDFGEEGIIFTDSQLNKIFLLSPDKKEICVLNEELILNRPTGIGYNRQKNEIWVVETGSHQISVLNKNGERIRTIGKRGTGPAEFNFPTYIWIDADGRVYIVDSMNFRIQILSSDGTFINKFGKQGDSTGSFARPRGIATDKNGNIFVADALFNNIQIFDQEGTLLYYFGTRGTGSFQFWMPAGIYIDSGDNIYVSDSYNSRVQVYHLKKREDR